MANTDYVTKKYLNEALSAVVKEIAELFSDGMRMISDRFDRVEARLDSLEGRFDGLEDRFDTMEGKFDDLQTISIRIDSKLNDQQERFEYNEAKLRLIQRKIA